MAIDQNCVTETQDPKIVLRDRKAKNPVSIMFCNDKREKVLIVEVDDCAITVGNRCDYLVLANGLEFFVELKGSDVSHAVVQIERSLQLLSQDRKTHPKRCYVISSRCPLSGPEIQEIQLRFKKIYNSTFKVKNNRFECNLE